jgi:hypothetical protein
MGPYVLIAVAEAAVFYFFGKAVARNAVSTVAAKRIKSMTKVMYQFLYDKDQHFDFIEHEAFKKAPPQTRELLALCFQNHAMQALGEMKECTCHSCSAEKASQKTPPPLPPQDNVSLH